MGASSRTVDGERRRERRGGGGRNTYVAFDGWSGFVLRVLVDVGDDFLAVGVRVCVMLLARKSAGKAINDKTYNIISAQRYTRNIQVWVNAARWVEHKRAQTSTPDCASVPLH